VQTNLISGVGQVTVNELLPRFQVQTDSALYEFTGLVRSLQDLVSQMKATQEGMETLEQRVLTTLQSYQEQSEGMHEDMTEIKHILKAGFRLHEDE
jgi:uncharacterized protein YukE